MRITVMLTAISMITAALTLAGVLFDYNLATFFDKDIPWYLDVVAGVCASPVNIPAAVLGLVLVACGVPTPIFA